MTDLMRNNLRPLFQTTTTAHAGLLIQRGLSCWEEGEKPTKKTLINKIASIKANDLYFLAFKRWLKHTHDSQPNAHFACVSATLVGRLFTGLPLGGTLETGVTTHHTYGMPMIAGSSIKGAVRNYTEHLFAQKDADQNVIYHNSKVVIADDKKAVIEVLFGADDDDNPNAGYLIWHDAWWIPPLTDNSTLSIGDKAKPFIDEVVTVHHQQYYNGTLPEALDIENPVPNQQVAVQGSFYFVIEAVPAWASYARTLLINTLTQQGLGSKTGTGYGYFKIDEKLLNSHLEELKKIQDAKIESTLTEEEKVITNFIKQLNNLQITWKGKPNANCGFVEFYNTIIEWDNKVMLEQAYKTITEQGKIWQGKPLSKSNSWKERLEKLKAKMA